MQDKLEELISKVYKKWKIKKRVADEPHPDEELLACFLENKLSDQEAGRIKRHLLSCSRCAESVAIQAKMILAEQAVREELIAQVKSFIPTLKDQPTILEILLLLKEKVIEIMQTNGDILVGREFMPAPVLRSHNIKDFKDEVTILKDFKDIRVEIRIENKSGHSVNLIVQAKEKQTQDIIKDLRVTLIKGDIELESYLSDYGKVVFEHVLLGKYTVEIANLEDKLATILLDIKT